MEKSREAARGELEWQVSRLRALVDGARAAAAASASSQGVGVGFAALEKESKRRMDTPVSLSAVTPHIQTFGTTFGREVRSPRLPGLCRKTCSG